MGNGGANRKLLPVVRQQVMFKDPLPESLEAMCEDHDSQQIVQIGNSTTYHPQLQKPQQRRQQHQQQQMNAGGTKSAACRRRERRKRVENNVAAMASSTTPQEFTDENTSTSA